MASHPEEVDITATSSVTEPEPMHSTHVASAQHEACAQCSKFPEVSTDRQFKQCLKCHSVSYCRKDCQKAHFKSHKKVCASLAQEYTKTHEPKMASRSPARGGERDRGLQKWQFDT